MAIVGTAWVTVNANTTNFQRQLSQAVRGAQGSIGRDADDLGRRISDGLGRSASTFSNFEQQARAANDAFFAMVTTGYALGPAIAGVVGGLSSLASGLFAVGAQAAAAIPSLIVLPSIFSAIIQAAGTLKLAFGGIGAALGEMGRAAGGGGGGAAVANNLRRIEDAERSLALVMERNRETLVRSAKAVADAEDNLTEARKRASESLQQLNFDAEDAAISEQRAAIELEKARETLMRVQDLPPNNTARREAELAFAEADLNYRQAIDRNKDLAKETAEANAKGVEGSDEVVDATERLQEAKDAQARAERDALRAQEDAIRALEDAKTALTGGASAAGGMSTAMSKLSKEAQDFVKYLYSLKGGIDLLRAAAGRDLFPKLTIAIQSLVERFFPRLLPILQETGSAIGDVAINFADVITKARNLESLDRIFGQNTTTIRRFGRSGANLYQIFIDLLDAARPLINRFTKWTVTLTDGWKQSVRARKETGSLRDIFVKAGDVAAQLGRIFSNIADALFGIGKEAAGPGSGGQKLLDAFEGATEKFQEFADRVSKDGKLSTFFKEVADNVISIGRLFVDISEGFLKLGNNEGVKGFAEALRPAADNIALMFERLTDGSPALGQFLEKLTGLILLFTETSSINTFFNVLSGALDKLIAFFGDPRVQRFLMIAAPIIGAVKAFTLLNKVGGFAGKVLFGYFVKLKALFTGTVTQIVAIGAKLGIAAAPALAIAAAIAAVVATLVLAYKNSEKFRKAVGELVDLVKVTLVEGFYEVRDAVKEVFGGGTNNSAVKFKDIFKAIGDVLSYVTPIIGKIMVSAIKSAVATFKSLIYYTGAFINAIKGVVKFVQAIVALFKGDWKNAGKLFGEAWESMKTAAKLAVKAIWEFVKSLWERFKRIPQLMWASMKLRWQLMVGIVRVAISLMLKTLRALPRLAGKFFAMMWDKFRDLLADTIDWFGRRLDDIVDFVKDLPKRFASAIKTLWDTFRDGVVAVREWFEDRIGDIVEYMIKLPGRFASATKTLWDAFRDGVTAVKSWFEDRISDIVEYMIKLPGRFASAIKTLWDTFRDGVVAVREWFRNRISEIVGFVTGIPGRIANTVSNMWDNFKTNTKILKDYIGDRIGEIVGFVTGLPGRIASTVSTLWDRFKTETGVLKDRVSDRIEDIKGFISSLPGHIARTALSMWDPIKDGLQTVIGAIIGAWNALDFSINLQVPDWVSQIPGMGWLAGKGWSVSDVIPDIPNPFAAAKGGVFHPQRGGSIIQIAEAGRPERVEPLDPDGLSKRDKAIIQLLAGGVGGGETTFNIFPSAAMDERELARQIDRILARRYKMSGNK